MEKNLLVGNGINIQFGGADTYSNSAIMKRVVKNIKVGKYIALTEDSLTPEEQLDILNGLVKIIDNIRAGGYTKYADGLFMQMELNRIKRTYPEKSTIESVCLEDYFLAFENFNNSFKEKDEEEINEFYRKVTFDFLQRIFVDSIYNDGKINDVYKKAFPGLQKYFDGFSNIFTTNYDYNIESVVGKTKSVCHLHGEFSRLSPRYDVNSKYYKTHQAVCDELIAKKVSGMNHVYSDAIMSWSWLDKYGELIKADTKIKENIFKSIGGQVEILGLSPNNDEHLFFLLNQNSNVKSIVYYYLNDKDIQEVPHHIKKPITFKKVSKLWNSMR